MSGREGKMRIERDYEFGKEKETEVEWRGRERGKGDGERDSEREGEIAHGLNRVHMHPPQD